MAQRRGSATLGNMLKQPPGLCCCLMQTLAPERIAFYHIKASQRDSMVCSAMMLVTYGQEIMPSSGIIAYLIGPAMLKLVVVRSTVLRATCSMLNTATRVNDESLFRSVESTDYSHSGERHACAAVRSTSSRIGDNKIHCRPLRTRCALKRAGLTQRLDAW